MNKVYFIFPSLIRVDIIGLNIIIWDKSNSNVNYQNFCKLWIQAKSIKKLKDEFTEKVSISCFKLDMPKLKG